MVELIEPADGETALIVYLSEWLARFPDFRDVTALEAMPSSTKTYEPPGEAVTVRLTGGTGVHLAADAQQLTLTAWGDGPDDTIRALNIARRCTALVRLAERLGYVAGVPCSNVQTLSLPYKDTDPVTGRARYSATFAVTMRGQIVHA